MSTPKSTAAKSTRVVQTPGSDPALNNEAATGTALSGAAIDAGAQGVGAGDDAFQATGTVLGGDTSEKSADKEAVDLTETQILQNQVAELSAMVRQLAAQRPASSMPQVEELPTMAEVMKNKPTVPVLTKEGWFVPEKSAVTRA